MDGSLMVSCSLFSSSPSGSVVFVTPFKGCCRSLIMCHDRLSMLFRIASVSPFVVVTQRFFPHLGWFYCRPHYLYVFPVLMLLSKLLRRVRLLLGPLLFAFITSSVCDSTSVYGRTWVLSSAGFVVFLAARPYSDARSPVSDGFWDFTEWFPVCAVLPSHRFLIHIGYQELSHSSLFVMFCQIYC